MQSSTSHASSSPPIPTQVYAPLASQNPASDREQDLTGSARHIAPRSVSTHVAGPWQVGRRTRQLRRSLRLYRTQRSARSSWQRVASCSKHSSAPSSPAQARDVGIRMAASSRLRGMVDRHLVHGTCSVAAPTASPPRLREVTCLLVWPATLPSRRETGYPHGVSDNPAWQLEFTPPPPPHTDRIRLEPLCPAVVELDYAALMSSRARLREELQWGAWPSDDLTYDEDRAALERHQAEFECREAYAYTVLDESGTCCLGCVYIEPWQGEALLALWVTDEQLEHGLESHLLSTVLEWVRERWPFSRLLVPLRPNNTRGIAVARALGCERIECGGLDEHENLVWHRSDTCAR